MFPRVLILLSLVFLITALTIGAQTELIAREVAAQHNRDWNDFLAIRATMDGAPENARVRAALRAEYDFLREVIAARVIAVREIPNDFSARAERYREFYAELKTYYVAIDYQLTRESRAFYNGVNFRVYVLGRVESRWEIVESSEAFVRQIVDAGWGFGTREEQIALHIQDARWRTGAFINPHGRVIDQVGAGDHTQPHHIRVYRVATGVIEEVDFYSYVINVLPNEWYGSWHAEALRAGALAVKMYGWYRVYIAKYPGQGFDARDDTWDQVYKSNSAYPTTTAAVDFTRGVGIERANGAIFETQYHAGVYDASGQSSGRVSQWGTKYWADQGKDSLFMLHYYYDNSPNTSGQLMQTFAYTPNRSPLVPTQIEPANGARGVSIAPTLRASVFSDPDVGDTHAQTWWEIRRANDNALMWDSGWRATELTTTLVPGNLLADGTRYKWRARYLDNKGAWSEPVPTFAEFTTTFRAVIPFVAR